MSLPPYVMAALPLGQGTPWLADRTIFLTRHGSHAYGTSLPTSDLDYRGVAVPPRDYFLGFTQNFEQAISKEPDSTVFDLRKFMSLALDCNPSVLEVLFTDEADHLLVTPEGRMLLDGRRLFLSSKVRFTFTGYAFAQLKRLEARRKDLHDPPKGPSTRNEARSELEAKYGYDTKHAMHLVRLLRMCREILTTGEVIVKRPDAQELLAIRHGAWSYEQLIEFARGEDAAMEGIYKTSVLPKVADRAAVDRLCVAIVEEMIGR